ncbi:DUF4440 domain-containing protein [Veronia nyctiphanis]|uniref:DUF4440 domain-containing protein n=1 Tax=Veronia nyctiphanis TaxID=1278244 RepID=A0A4Q0YNZ2_9GAMM|nr:SgcJ/EcaC family oxidoreductase [Veronia nyctiphanis]RXJ72707.1 DUF4440 domain-containing protein [Veronia nyctiphanis]
MNGSQIKSLFDDWNNALKTLEPKNVVALYDTEAILLPTVSNKVRHSHEEIEDYFTDFLQRHPAGTINESNVRLFGELAIHSGVYTFTFKDSGPVQARFTFVYKWNGSKWMIVEHHSSQMPEHVELDKTA